jgi:hypothetical protein
MKPGDTIFLVSRGYKHHTRIATATISRETPAFYYFDHVRATSVFPSGDTYVGKRVRKEASGYRGWKPVSTFQKAKDWCLQELGREQSRLYVDIAEFEYMINSLTALEQEKKE